jgi:hypothetical protein
VFYHFAAVIAGSNMTLYVDGTLVGTASDSTAFTSPLNIVIGTDATTVLTNREVDARGKGVVGCRAKWQPALPPMAPRLLSPLGMGMASLTTHARGVHAGVMAG